MSHKDVGHYGVGIIGNCCTHGEFVAAALKAKAQAKIIAGWEKEPRRQPALAEAIGRPLTASPEALLDNPDIDIIAIACSPHEKAAWVEKAAQARNRRIGLRNKCWTPSAETDELDSGIYSGKLTKKIDSNERPAYSTRTQTTPYL